MLSSLLINSGILAIYSITDLEKLTGIKAHTIRIWEKRFNIIHPKRTQTNIRYYDDQDLKKITNIALLNQKGYKISLISNMPEHEVEDLVAHLTDVAFFNADSLDALTLSIIQLDQDKFNHIIERHIKQHGFDHTFDELFMPLLDKLHEMWLAGSIRKAHEEFAMQLIKRRIIHQIILLEDKPKTAATKFVMVMLGFENQQMSRFFVEYQLARRGIACLYMSNDSDIRDIVEAVQAFKAAYVISFANEESTLPIALQLVKALNKNPEAVKPVFIGYLIHEISQACPDCICIQNFDHLQSFLSELV